MLFEKLFSERVSSSSTQDRTDSPSYQVDSKAGLVVKGSIILITILTFIILSISRLQAVNEVFRVLEAQDDYTLIEFNLDSYEQHTQEVNGIGYQRFFHHAAGTLMNEGLPELLTFSTTLSIPFGSSVRLTEQTLIDSRILSNINIFPSQGFNMEIDDNKGFIKDSDFYLKNTQYPSSIIQTGQPATLRDVRIVNITVSPFIYNPQDSELTINKKMTFRVNYDISAPDDNQLLQSARPLSRSFEPLYKGVLLNYEQFRQPDPDYQHRSILIVRHHSQAIDGLVEQFVDWKRDKGFIVNTINTAAYSTALAIRNYIREAYFTWDDPPEYVVIIGGGAGPLAVPYWFAHHGPGDHPYTLMDDSDDISDIFIGRISVDSAYELATVWNKIRTYERNPFINESFNWHQNQLLVGDPRVSGISTINTNKYIKEIMNRRFDNYTYTEIYDGNFAIQINSALNDGANFFSFRGLELMGGWNPDEDEAFNNRAMTPNATLITCNTLDFNGGKQVEPFFRTGTPTSPRGSVSGIGMTTNYTLTSFNSCLAGGIYHGLFIDDMRTMGEALVRGKLYVWQVFGVIHSSQPPQYSHWANLIGDPSMDVWLQKPAPLNVEYDAQLPPGSNSISVIITDNDNNPLQDVWVTVRKADDTVFATDYTGQDGEIVLFFNPNTEGQLRLTATKRNYLPHLGGFSIAGTPAVSFDSIDLRGELTPGEQHYFDLTLKNHTQENKDGLSALIYTDDGYLELLNTTAHYTAIDAGGTAIGNDPFLLYIAADIPDEHRARFLLTVSDSEDNIWHSRFEIRFINGNLVPVEIVVSGEEENYLQPTETGSLVISLQNKGAVALDDVYGVISTSARGLRVIDSLAYFGDAGIDAFMINDDYPFKVYADSTAIPGMVFEIDLILYNEAGYYQQQSIRLPLGNVSVTDPFGPDSYGYWCYDEGDSDYVDAPVYDWIEITPAKGGNGINTGLEADYLDHQEVIRHDLPFTFRFYGIDYDVISICANGWMSFGVTEQSTHKNWRLPGALGAYAMVAAFWDNLSLREGGVYTYYCSDEHLFVIQWENALNIMQDAPQTFQIILYDPQHYPTITGDGGIKIQYKVFNNINNGAATPSGTGNWGNYATIGIADHTCTIGLEYTFNNLYPVAAGPIENESAIYFTTGYGELLSTDDKLEDELTPSSYLFNAYPNPFNPETTIQFSIPGSDNVQLKIYNITGQHVKTLVDQHLDAGIHSVTWQGTDDRGLKTGSGIYFYRLTTSNYQEVKKVVLLK